MGLQAKSFCYQSNGTRRAGPRNSRDSHFGAKMVPIRLYRSKRCIGMVCVGIDNRPIISGLLEVATARQAVTELHTSLRGYVSDHGLKTTPSEGEGACLAEFSGRYHLPLRGKLGWMTPRIRCENDARYETCLSGLPVPSWSPLF